VTQRPACRRMLSNLTEVVVSDSDAMQFASWLEDSEKQ
jgi:hypothetical protein